MPAVRHVTLTPNEVESVKAPGEAFLGVTYYVGILHRGNVDADVWVTVEGSDDPEPEGDDTYVVMAGSQRVILRRAATDTSTVRLLCTQAAKVEVEFT